MANILIVEDKIDLANLVRSYLEYEEHEVEMLHAGGSAQERIDRGLFDLIILDWDLPEVSGIEILKTMRASGSATPVLMLTGKNTITDKETGFEEGADDYLTKPFDMKELAMRVKALLRRSARSQTSASKPSESITLNPDRLRATKDGRPIALTQKEFDLLQYLLQEKAPHDPQIILQRLWSSDSSANFDLLRTTLKRLKKKLGPETPQLRDDNFPGLMPVSPQPDSKVQSESLDDDDAIDPFLGNIIDEKYELVELIGGGGTGVVYKANHSLLNTIVAVKMLFPHMVAKQQVLRRFQQEAKATASLSHPNILKVIDFGTGERGQPYLVMEYLNGVSLSDLIDDEGSIAPLLVAEIIAQAAAGLLHAHGKGVVHRDIKPSNLMIIGSVYERFTVKIVDFGLARPQNNETTSKITTTGEVFGSPAYMSPEQCRGETVDHRGDIYALGCVMFEALTGRPPFVGKDPVDTILQQVSPKPLEFSISGANQELNEQLEKIITLSLAKDKEQRYQSIGHLLEDILKFREQLLSTGAKTSIAQP